VCEPERVKRRGVPKGRAVKAQAGNSGPPRQGICVEARLLGPERWWTMPEHDEAWGNSGGSRKRCWRANRSSDLGI